MSSHRAPGGGVLDDDDSLTDSANPHASATRWRHQESSAYARHAAHPRQHHQHGRQPVAREPDAQGRVNELADFLNSSRIAPETSGRGRPAEKPGTPRSIPIVAGGGEGRGAADAAWPHSDGTEIAVGPLLNYRRMEAGTWIGSVLVVTRGGGKEQPPFVPTLLLGRAGAGPDAEGAGGGQPSAAGAAEVRGVCLYSDPRNTFWRFDVRVPIERVETRWEYTLPGLRFASSTKPRRNAFYVAPADECFRIMFHSCNGFSVGTDEAAWSGPALWNDVARRHAEVPFHVMIGGGDQIYNDGIRVTGPLKEWTSISNPKKRKDYPFPEKLRQDCDDYYLRNYIRWYGTEPFASVNGQIPQVNIWDDHDIIDGFGSYVHEFMLCDVFRGIGGLAHKYYMLFQHHLPPPPSTYTSDDVSTHQPISDRMASPNQLANAYVHPGMIEPNYIVGSSPGPYVSERSHNIFTKLGPRIALVGVDARTERTRHQVNYPETYNQIFERLRQELGGAAQAGQPFRHLILLLGIPIAYPRLTWLENVFTSPVIGPIKFMNRRFGLGGSFFNSFDGSVDLLDDLDDHYTARTHKKERNQFIERLQGICADFSVRLTILGGDVHLAALGRFYSNPRLGIPVENDHRYMVNVVSSAIVNKPPPQAIANLLARRNKIHHLDRHTDETLLALFDKDPGTSARTAGHNQVTMPSRNFAMITENSPNNAGGRGQAAAPTDPPTTTSSSSSSARGDGTDGHSPLHAGEVGAGTRHKAASALQHGGGSDGGLDICIRVEIDQHDPEGHTEPYGLTVPALAYERPPTAAGSARTRWSRRTGSQRTASTTDGAP